MLVVLLIAGCLAIFLVGVALLPESPYENFVREHNERKQLRKKPTKDTVTAEQRLEKNIRLARGTGSYGDQCEFKSDAERKQFIVELQKLHIKHDLAAMWRYNVEQYEATMPLTGIEAMKQLENERELYRKRCNGYGYTLPWADVQQQNKLEALKLRDAKAYNKAVYKTMTSNWFNIPNDDTYMFCILDLMVNVMTIDTKRLALYIGRLTDTGLEKLMNIIGNKLERLNG